MKLHFLSSYIQKKLIFVNHAISSRNQLPVLLNILLETENGKLVLSATDLEIGIQTEIPANVLEKGAITVPAKTFTDLINSLPEEKITMSAQNGVLEVVSTKTKSRLQTIPKEEFPKLYEEQGQELMVMEKEDIQKNFKKVAFAASLDAGRPALSGVLVQKKEPREEGELLFVATDGYRLSLKQHKEDQRKREEKETVEKSMLIPARVIKEVILMNQEGNVRVCVSKQNNQVLFFQNETVVVGRLIEAEFPAYEKIIPQEHETSAVFNKEEMQAAVRICSIFARETANIVRLAIQKEKIVVSANAPSVGENLVEVDAKLTGEENEIAFNARYLLDLFANIEENEMVFEMTGPLSPGVFKIKDDPSFLHLIMPIRIQAGTES